MINQSKQKVAAEAMMMMMMTTVTLIAFTNQPFSAKSQAVNSQAALVMTTADSFFSHFTFTQKRRQN